jgi:hypothetical protein
VTRLFDSPPMPRHRYVRLHVHSRLTLSEVVDKNRIVTRAQNLERSRPFAAYSGVPVAEEELASLGDCGPRSFTMTQCARHPSSERRVYPRGDTQIVAIVSRRKLASTVQFASLFAALVLDTRGGRTHPSPADRRLLTDGAVYIGSCI